jgi:Arc-like DNA binding domain
MAGKAKGVPRDTAVALRLPRELHTQLKRAAAGRSVSEEMRSRLEQSLLRDLKDDARTRALTEAMGELARNVKPYYGAWHENPYAFAVFRIAVENLLSKMRPKGEPVAPSNTDEWLPGDTPESAGGNLARATIIARNLS